jgi:hypothetical protein
MRVSSKSCSKSPFGRLEPKCPLLVNTLWFTTTMTDPKALPSPSCCPASRYPRSPALARCQSPSRHQLASQQQIRCGFATGLHHLRSPCEYFFPLPSECREGEEWEWEGEWEDGRGWRCLLMCIGEGTKRVRPQGRDIMIMRGIKKKW